MTGWWHCDNCGKRTSAKQMDVVCVSDRTWDSPAEYEVYCRRPSCDVNGERDEAYERAAARYDGEGKDWR